MQDWLQLTGGTPEFTGDRQSFRSKQGEDICILFLRRSHQKGSKYSRRLGGKGGGHSSEIDPCLACARPWVRSQPCISKQGDYRTVSIYSSLDECPNLSFKRQKGFVYVCNRENVRPRMMKRQKGYLDFWGKTKPSWLTLPSLKWPGEHQGGCCPHEIDGVYTGVSHEVEWPCVPFTTPGVSKQKTLPHRLRAQRLYCISLLKGSQPSTLHYHPLNSHRAPAFLSELLVQWMPTDAG